MKGVTSAEAITLQTDLQRCDCNHQVIVAIGVSNQPSDAVHLLPMLERIQVNTGQLPAALTADAGSPGLHLDQPPATRPTAQAIAE